MPCSRERNPSLQLISYFHAASYPSWHLNPLGPDTQPGTCSHCFIGHPPPKCILVSKYWVGLRARAASFSPPPPQNARVLSVYFLALPSHIRGDSTPGLFLRLPGSVSFLFSPPHGDQILPGRFISSFLRSTHCRAEFNESASLCKHRGDSGSGCLSSQGAGLPTPGQYQPPARSPGKLCEGLQLHHSLFCSRPQLSVLS